MTNNHIFCSKCNNTFGNNPSNICNGANKWCNATDPTSYLFTNYASSITTNTGLPLLNNKIIGPSSIDLLQFVGNHLYQ